MAEATTPGAYGRFMGRWGWPLMGLLAAAPVIAGALDWRTRTEIKQKMKDEKRKQVLRQAQELGMLVPTAEDVYKSAAYARSLAGMPKRAAVEKLDLLSQVLQSGE